MSKSDRKKRARVALVKNRPSASPSPRPTPATATNSTSAPSHVGWTSVLMVSAMLLPALAWAYWPTLRKLVATWDSDPDYSHGYLVVPLALLFMWSRRQRLPGLSGQWRWGGLLLIAASVGMRLLAGRMYNDSLDAWSIPVWIAGVVLLLAGWPMLRWALPSIAFLWFMAPLPFRVENMLSLPLQGVATNVSSWTLQFLGQPALAEGHTILLGDHVLEVEQACSGLRIFIGIFALAYAYVVLFHRPVWQKVLLILSALPIAIVANATRIVGTGLLYQLASAEAAHKFIHDVAGWVMIPLAALLFAVVLFYLDRLFREVEVLDVGDVVRVGRV